MNTKIGTSFGLAALMAIAAIATMFALGMFSANEVRADHNTTSTKVHGITFTPSSGSVNGGGSWSVTFGVSAALVAGSGTATVTFPTGVTLPATIDKSRMSAGAGTDLNPLTSDATISTSTRKVTFTVPATNSAGAAVSDAIDAGDTVTVFFSQLAGILNPAKSGVAGTTAATQGDVVTSEQATANTVVNSSATPSFATTMSVSATTAAEGDSVTVTLGGFTPGLTVSLDAGGALAGSATVGTDRKATITADRKGTGTTVDATDTAGITAGTKTLSLKAALTVTATGKAGDTITLTGKNFTAGSNVAGISSILFGGSAIVAGQKVTTLPYTLVDKDADSTLDDFAIKILIPSGAKSGINQIKVTDAAAVSATANVTVTGRSVVITPDSGPPGTVVTITGTGFPASIATASANTSAISGPSGPGTVTGLFTDGSGALPGSDQFTIPAGAATSTITLTVSILGADSVASTGSDKFTVTSRVLTVAPTSGPRGTKVLITGTKFTASNTVTANTITVDGVTATHAVANLTSSGDVPGISLDIPAAAGIGSKTISLADNASTPLVGTTKFEVTVPTIASASDSATMGESVTVTGAGWVPNKTVTVTLKSATVTVATKVATSDSNGDFETTVAIPTTVGVGPKTVTFTAADAATYGNTATAVNVKITKPAVTLSVAEAVVGSVVDVEASGFAPQSGLSVLTIGGADVKVGVTTSDTLGSLSTSFIVPGVTGSNIVTVTVGAESVSTSINVVASTVVAAAATTAPADIFADVIANDDNLVRVWRFDNATQGWNFYDPRPAFAAANTLEKSGAGDIVWVNVSVAQTVATLTDTNAGALVIGWNLIVLK